MKIGQVISMAKGGELKSVAIKYDSNDIVEFINLAMIELYKRFPLKTSEWLIELQDNVTEYQVPDDKHFMYISSAYQELSQDDNGIDNRLGINDEDDPLAINMVSWDTVQIPVSVTGAYVSIIYVEAPPMIIWDEAGTYLEQKLDLPPQLLEALLHYVGYRAHGSITADIKTESNTYYQRFEASCNRARQLGLVTRESLKSHHKFNHRGYA